MRYLLLSLLAMMTVKRLRHFLHAYKGLQDLKSLLEPLVQLTMVEFAHAIRTLGLRLNWLKLGQMSYPLITSNPAMENGSIA